MLLTRTVAPTYSPVSLLDAKEHLRIDADADDRVIERMLSAAVGAIGEMTGRSLAAETWQLGLDGITGDLTLPKSPVTAVSGIAYYDNNNTSQTYSLSNVNVSLSDDRAVISLKSGCAWPVTTRRPDAVNITFTTGYTTLPDELVSAVMLKLGDLYFNRGDAKAGDADYQIECLVSLYRLGWAAG